MFVGEDEGWGTRIAQKFTARDGHPEGDASRVPGTKHAAVQTGIDDGLKLVEEYHVGYAETVGQLIAVIVVGSNSAVLSGSDSSQLATIFLSPRDNWGQLDYAEAILHEGVHQAQFLDQMIEPWFERPHWDLNREELMVISPIRRVRRPLPLTLEAACVAAVLLDLLWWVGDHGRATEMAVATAESLTGVKKLDQLLSSRGRSIVDQLAGAVSVSPALAAAE